MKKILIIEDNEDVRENTADILALANYEVMTAENGKTGVMRAKQFIPDLVICDIMMPELDGYEVLRLLGADNNTAGIPFIFLTAKTDKADIRQGMNLGADDYLTKPFDENELLEAISCRIRKNDSQKNRIVKNIEGLSTFLGEASKYVDLESLSKGHTGKLYKKKELIFREGNLAHSLYFVESGTVKTYKSTESGKEFVTGLYSAGDFLGQLSLLDTGGKYLENAIIIEGGLLSAIPRNDFIKLLYGNPTVSEKFIRMISNNLISMQKQLVLMAFASVRQRAAQALMELYEKGIVGETNHSGTGIAREDFAGMIGTATETAIRTLSDFKEEGLIKTDKVRRIVVLNKKQLQKIAEHG